MVFWRVHALYLLAASFIYVTSFSVMSYDGNSAHASHNLHMYYMQGDKLVLFAVAL